MNFDESNQLNHIIEEKDKEILRLTQALEQQKSTFQGTIQDIRDYYEEILTLLPGHIYWLDKDNVFLGCNESQARNARLLERKDIIGKTNFDLPWKDQAEELNNINTKVMTTGIAHISEEYAVMADGTSVYLSNKIPLRNKDNHIIGILGVSIDITERKKMEVALRHAKERAEAANSIKSEFISNMSQDLRTPLDGIMELSKQLELQLADNKNKEYASWIYESSKQLLNSLNGLFDLAGNDTIQETDINLQPFKLRDSIQDISALLYPKIKLNCIDFKLDISENVPENLLTDAIKIQRVLSILLIHAIQHTESGTITIKVELLARDSAYAQLKFTISHSGSTIPIEMHSTLFNKSSTKEPAQDQSLYIAQKYVGLLGGEINIDSELNKGSTFYFTLSLKMI